MSKSIAIEPEFAASLSRTVQPQRRTRVVRDAIVDAAERLFIEQGYHGTRVSEVARIADVSIGSIYVHFENKEGLYAALMERALDYETRYFDSIFENSELNDIEKIFLVGEAYLQFFRDHPAYFRILMVPHEDVPESAADTAVGRQVVDRGQRQRRQLAELIARCIDQKLLRDDVDPDNAAYFWWAAWNGVITLTLRRDAMGIDSKDLEAVIIEGRRMIAHGIASAAMRDADGGLVMELRSRLEAITIPHVEIEN